MGDACSNPPDADGVQKMIMKNFDRHYTTNRLVESVTDFLNFISYISVISEPPSVCFIMRLGSLSPITKKDSSNS